MKFWLANLLIFGFSALNGLGAPKEEDFGPPPPMAQGQTVSLYLGQSVEVPLKAIGRAPNPLRFLIRTPPQHGKLGEIHITGNKTAFVTYTHDEKAGLAADSFTFAVQAMDGPVSAQGVINIVVSEEPPAFATEAEVEFPKVWTGGASEQEIVIKNTGGGIIKGTANLTSPWKIIGKADYWLARKQAAKLLIQFAPKDAGAYRDKLTFSHDGKAAVRLIGRAAAAFEFEPSKKVELSTEGNAMARTGKLLIRNKTDQERTVKITVPPEIAAPKEVTIAAGGEQNISLQTIADFVEALDGSITIESDGFSQQLDLHVFALPPRLKFEPAAGIAFGEIQSERHYKSTLTLINSGGDSAHLRASMPKEIRIQPDPNSEVIKIGEKRVFEVAFESGKPGNYQGTIEIKPEDGLGISVPVTARIAPPPAAPEKASTATLTPRDTSPEIATGPELGKYNDTPAVTAIKTLKTGKYELEIGWQKPGPNAVAYLLEVRSLMPAGRAPKIVWTEWRDVKYLEENGLSIARVERLHPGQALFFRISSIDGTGKHSRPSETIRLYTPPATKINWLWCITALLMAGAIANHFVRVRKQKRLEALADAARLAQIEGE
ncbi:hypothetical protein BH09VER1_BH09VER1_15750 [soil metagenome]